MNDDVTIQMNAPGGVSGVYYSGTGIPGHMLGDISTINYENGTHGTFNVVYPDVLTPNNSSESILRYVNVATQNLGGVSFNEFFPGGSESGKLVDFGFPFKTVYAVDTRNSFMLEVLEYLHIAPNAINELGSTRPDDFQFLQNYPNPFNPSTTFRFALPETSRLNLTIYIIQGQRVKTLITGSLAPGCMK